jgi:FdhD protein
VGRLTVRRTVTRVQREGARRTRPDTIVVEEPLEIRVSGAALAVTMRTPGKDMDLAVGFLLTEGVITKADDLRTMRFCGGSASAQETDLEGAAPPAGNSYNVLDVDLAPHVAPPQPSVERAFYTTSSCGICGKASIDAIRPRTAYPVQGDPVSFSAEMLLQLPERLRAAQQVFDRTGGLHAAGIFDATGELLVLREDVGRHNAVDKVIGWAVRENRIPLSGTVLLVSGRASFELTQKALMAGIPALAAVSAPSSLAVELAEEVGMTLVGFLRGDTMNVYAGAQRIPD